MFKQSDIPIAIKGAILATGPLLSLLFLLVLYGLLSQLGLAWHQGIQYLLFVSIAVNLATAIAIPVFFTSGIARPLRALLENTGRLTCKQPLLPALTGKDEIAQLDQALNKMASALEQAARQEKLEELLLNESRAAVRLILESMPIGVVVIDDNGHIDLANSRAAHMYGAPLRAFTGKHIQSLLSNINLTDPLASQLEKFAACSTENSMSRADGSMMPVDITVNQFMMHGRRKILINIIDSIERYEAERLQQEFQSLLNQNVSSPLTSIKASLAMIATGTVGRLTKSGTELLQRAQCASDRLIALVNDLLHIERIRSSRMQLDLTPLLVSSIMQQTIDSTAYLAQQKDIRIEMRGYDKDVYADEARIVQVLVNLVSNAIKFSPPDSTITIRVSEIPEWLEFRVSDEGSGIPKDSLDRIFAKHARVSPSDLRRGYGTGMGLAIAKAIIEHHDGIIGAESEQGCGSTFWFRLPHSTSL